ncbi:MAG TPA: hypothetical protein VF613_04510 [Longimicrobium sp.]
MQPDQTDLPGVGTRFTLPLSAGGRLEIVVLGPEQREIYFFSRENEPSAGFRLDAGEACALATLLCDVLARLKEAWMESSRSLSPRPLRRDAAGRPGAWSVNVRR